ncbi:MAG: cytidylate kinase-like family protein [Oscillospiraceae bacterium]|nr:cytidylate kinase-like family protein [Oscillospiraceae bacterium]
MSKVEKRIITISREFGSGGRTIAKTLAERLGLTYYDKELVKQMAIETWLDQQFVSDESEYAPSKSAFAYNFQEGMLGGLCAADILWDVQRKVILQLADKEPCVIVGRNADYILKDRADCLRVFIHADTSFRAERIVSLYGTTEKTPEERLKDKDTKRRINYKHFTEKEWGMSQNYHISLNSGAIGIDKCVDIIADLFTGQSNPAK